MEAVVREKSRFAETSSLALIDSMLLLPLILWWAHAPLRTAQGRLRIFIATIILLTIVVTSASTKPCIADDRYDRGKQRSINERHHLVVEQAEDRIVIREGATIPPTPGQIVMLGRRWAFIPAGSNRSMPGELTTRPKHSDRSVVSFRASMLNSSDRPKPVRLGLGNPSNKRNRESASPEFASSTLLTSTPAAPRQNLSQMLLTENLMLQRIVEAIRIDASDDRWSISGEVTEFFGENRFLIRTAQRASQQ
ncbi:MAG: hypothetical protein AB8B91_18630 [Rubripirellula sp.]